MKTSIPKSPRPLAKGKKLARPSMTRDDLSFTARIDRPDYPDDPSIVNWAPPEVPAQINQWDIGRDLGLAMMSELAALANANEVEAFNAIRFAFTSDGWRSDGSGPECGFSEGIAALAMLGLRQLARGGQPFDPANPKPAVYWTGKRILEKRTKEVKLACPALFKLHMGRAQGACMALLEAGWIDNETYMKTYEDLRAIEDERGRVRA